LSAFLSQRMKIRRKRLSQLCVRSTTPRRALTPALRLSACASSPRARLCAVKPHTASVARTSSESYPLSRHRPCGCSALGSGRSTTRRESVGGRDQVQVRPIGAGHDYCQRHAMTLGPDTALDTGFAAIRGGGAGFFPRPRELWSGHRPGLTTASLLLSAPQTAPRPLARVSKTLQRLPIPESAHGRWSGGRGRWRPRRPTDSPCAAHRRWRRHTGDRGCAACHRQTDACLRASGVSAVARPTTHPIRENRSLLCLRALVGVAFCSVPCPQFIKPRLSG
jgi:hypothetical protein